MSMLIMSALLKKYKILNYIFITYILYVYMALLFAVQDDKNLSFGNDFFEIYEKLF